MREYLVKCEIGYELHQIGAHFELVPQVLVYLLFFHFCELFLVEAGRANQPHAQNPLLNERRQMRRNQSAVGVPHDQQFFEVEEFDHLHDGPREETHGRSELFEIEI